MSRLEINEGFVIGVLKDYELRLKEVHDEIMTIFRNIIEKKELLETLQTGRGSKAAGDLQMVLVLSERKQQEYALELYALLQELQKKEEAIRRIWVCYEALPFELKDILTQLYIKNIKWEAVAMSVSKSTLVKRRGEALRQLFKFYESTYSNTDIFRLGNIGHRYETQTAEEENTVKQEQLAFDLTGGEVNI